MPSVQVEGLSEAKATVAALPDAFKEGIADAIDVGSAIILTEADRRVPVRTGTLKHSGSRSVRGDGMEAIVGYSDFKAHFVEFGTNDTPAEPFLYPAFRIGAKYIRKVLRTAANDAAEKAIEGNVNAGRTSIGSGMGGQVSFRARRRKAKA